MKTKKAKSQGFKKAEQGLEALLDQAQKLKHRYDELDEPTKKKVKAGIAGATALLIGLAAVKKAKRRKRKNNS